MGVAMLGETNSQFRRLVRQVVRTPPVPSHRQCRRGPLAGGQMVYDELIGTAGTKGLRPPLRPVQKDPDLPRSFSRIL